MNEQELVKQLNDILDEVILNWIGSNDTLMNEGYCDVDTVVHNINSEINAIRQEFNHRLNKLIRLNKGKGN